MPDLKKIIESFIQHNSVVLNILKNTADNAGNVNQLHVASSDIINEVRFDTALAVDFACSLQIINDENNYQQYNLTDVRNLFDSILGVHESISDVHVESAHFEWAVMNDGERAKEIIAAGVEEASRKIDELNKLLSLINSD